MTPVTGENVVYKVDYGDGAGFTSENETGLESRELHLPGKHVITLTASNAVGSVTVTMTLHFQFLRLLNTSRGEQRYSMLKMANLNLMLRVNTGI